MIPGCHIRCDRNEFCHLRCATAREKAVNQTRSQRMNGLSSSRADSSPTFLVLLFYLDYLQCQEQLELLVECCLQGMFHSGVCLCSAYALLDVIQNHSFVGLISCRAIL